MEERNAHKMRLGEGAALIALEEKRKVRRKRPERGRAGGEEGAGWGEKRAAPPSPAPILRPGA